MGINRALQYIEMERNVGWKDEESPKFLEKRARGYTTRGEAGLGRLREGAFLAV